MDSPRIVLDPGDEEELTRRAAGSAPTALRARIVLLSAAGLSVTGIAQHLGTSRPTVSAWRRRYREGGLRALEDSARTGRPRSVDTGAILWTTLREPPPSGDRGWTCRSVAAHLAVSSATVARTWRDHGVVPTRSGRFDLAVTPTLPASPVAVVGLHDGTDGSVVALRRRGAAARPAGADGAVDLVRRCGDATPSGPGGILHVLADARARAELRRSPAMRAWWARHPEVVLHVAGPAVAWSRLRTAVLLAGSTPSHFCDADPSDPRLTNRFPTYADLR